MRNGIMFLLAVLVAVAVMLVPQSADAGGFGVQAVAIQPFGFHQRSAFVQPLAVPVNAQFFSNRGVFVAAPHPQAVFVQAVPRVHGVQVRAVQVRNVNRGFNRGGVRVQRVRSVQRFRR